MPFKFCRVQFKKNSSHANVGNSACSFKVDLKSADQTELT